MNIDNETILSGVTSIEVDTKANKEADSVATDLQIKWDGMTVADLRELAQQALVIKLQNGWRKNGIPAGKHEVNAVDFKVGTRAKRTPADAGTLIAKMDPEARKAFILAQMEALGLS